MIPFRLHLFSTVLLAGAAAPAQGTWPPVEFHELLLDPPGPNAGAQVVEVRAGSLPVDTAGWQLVAAGGVATPLPPVVLAPFAIVQLHLGIAGPNSPSDLYLPGAPLLGPVGVLALARQAPVTTADLVDFVGWNGGSSDPLTVIAVQVARWPNTGANLVLPAEGHSLANYGNDRPVWIGPDAWYADGTPTLGLPNDPGLTRNRAQGCLTVYAPVVTTPSNIDTGPWLGEVHTLVFGYLPNGSGLFFLVTGLQDTGPVPLGAFGMPQCASFLSYDAVLVLPYFQGQAQFAWLVPSAPSFVGVQFLAQSLVVDATPWHPGPQVSNALILRLGSR